MQVPWPLPSIQHHYAFVDCSVYHEAERNLYFYSKGENWQVSASLPVDLEVNLGEHVSIDLDTDRPYLYNDDHRKKYPPGKKQKKSPKEK
jgi:hypothetical protein